MSTSELSMEPATDPPRSEVSEQSMRPVSGWRRAWRGLLAGVTWLGGLVVLVAGLAGLAAFPLLNLCALGYLVEAGGRVATTGRWRSGFIGIRPAARLGGMVAGLWLVLLPVRLAVDLAQDAELIAPGSATADGWRAGAMLLGGVVTFHVVWAVLRGGRFRHFLWPAPRAFVRWARGTDKLAAVSELAGTLAGGLQLPRYFWLGTRALLGTAAWLALPVLALFGAAQLPAGAGAGVLSLIGAASLMMVAVQLPFLQTRFARTKRWRAMFEIRAVRAAYGRAPLAFALALTLTLGTAIPLYLLKIELPPRELVWLPGVLFIVSGWPARLAAGWALHRAGKRERPCHRLLRWSARAGLVTIAMAYVLAVYFNQYLSWNGSYSLLEQHAFTVPTPGGRW